MRSFPIIFSVLKMEQTCFHWQDVCTSSHLFALDVPLISLSAVTSSVGQANQATINTIDFVIWHATLELSCIDNTFYEYDQSKICQYPLSNKQ